MQREDGGSDKKGESEWPEKKMNVLSTLISKAPVFIKLLTMVEPKNHTAASDMICAFKERVDKAR